MTKEEVKALIRTLSEETLAEAFTTQVVGSRGSFCDGLKYRNTVEHSELPYPHICLYPIGEVGIGDQDQAVTYQIQMGIFDHYPFEDTNSEGYAVIQERVGQILQIFRTKLKAATDNNGAPYTYAVRSIYEEDRFDIRIGTGRSFTWELKNESTGIC